MRTAAHLALAWLLCCGAARADDPVFSGPQAGEPLPPFKVRGVLGEAAGKEIDLVAQADGKPLVLLFVHKVTRPSVGLVRALADYAGKQQNVTCGVVFLDDDATQTEQWMKRAQHALPQTVPVAISPDGAEGPGSYGLNRNVTLTILVGVESKATANFALVQPSLQADALKIGRAIAKAAGAEPPTLAQLTPQRAGEVNLRPLLAPVINKQATPEEVAAAAAKVEQQAARNRAFRQQLGKSAKRIVDSGKLENYGTPAAQKFIEKWAKEYYVDTLQ